MTQRVAAAQAAFDAYHDKTFIWGKRDCVRLAAYALKRLGYQPGLARGGGYTNELGAVRALKRAGFDSVEAWMADVVGELELVGIPPAAALPGDIVGFHMPQFALTGLTIAMSNGRLLGFDDDKICRVAAPKLDPEYLKSNGVTAMAWRCDPRLQEGA